VSGQLHAPVALSPGNEPTEPLDVGLGGPQNRSAGGGEEKNLATTGTRTSNFWPSSPWAVAVPSALSRLPASINTQARSEELLEASFSVRSRSTKRK
jgi:hypothetical protein